MQLLKPMRECAIRLVLAPANSIPRVAQLVRAEAALEATASALDDLWCRRLMHDCSSRCRILKLTRRRCWIHGSHLVENHAALLANGRPWGRLASSSHRSRVGNPL